MMQEARHFTLFGKPIVLRKDYIGLMSADGKTITIDVHNKKRADAETLPDCTQRPHSRTP